MNSDKHFEEPEIVGVKRKDQGRGSFHRGESINEVFRDFAKEGGQTLEKSIFWKAFWPVVGVLFVIFVVLALFVTLLFWLLPFAIAAFIVGLFVFGSVALVRGVIALFKK